MFYIGSACFEANSFSADGADNAFSKRIGRVFHFSNFLCVAQAGVAPTASAPC